MPYLSYNIHCLSRNPKSHLCPSWYCAATTTSVCYSVDLPRVSIWETPGTQKCNVGMSISRISYQTHICTYIHELQVVCHIGIMGRLARSQCIAACTRGTMNKTKIYCFFIQKLTLQPILEQQRLHNNGTTTAHTPQTCDQSR